MYSAASPARAGRVAPDPALLTDSSNMMIAIVKKLSPFGCSTYATSREIGQHFRQEALLYPVQPWSAITSKNAG